MNHNNLPIGFAEFYKAYPRKVKKGDAAKAFVQVSANDVLPDILKDLKRRQWPLDRSFIPYPATYLRAWMWLDEPDSDEEGDQDDW